MMEFITKFAQIQLTQLLLLQLIKQSISVLLVDKVLKLFNMSFISKHSFPQCLNVTRVSLSLIDPSFLIVLTLLVLLFDLCLKVF